ncbi:MAG: hypothetical protein HRU41_19755 [Saprospiraceae bacterium]|nr:hypothetical protein [Saprospiraceae bacterium]
MSSSNTLSEKYIQDKAIKYLKRYYKASSANGKVFAQAEVRTQQKKRADGLIAWRKWLGGVGVASMEAKSAKTLSALVKQLDDTKVKRDSTWLTVLVVFLGAYILWDQGLRAYMEPLYVLMLYGVLFFLIPYIQKMLQGINLPFHQRIAVFDQLLQYPANEPWVAIGSDSVNAKQYKALKQSCRKKRLGLLLVQKNGRVKLELKPRYLFSFPKRDFLTYYEKGESIRKQVQKGSNWKIWTLIGTTSQMRSTVYHFGLALAGFLAIYGAMYVRERTPDNEPQEIEEVTTIPSTRDPFAFLDTLRANLSGKPIESIVSDKQDCSNTTIFGPKYIVRDQIVRQESAAQARVQELKAAGFPDSDYLWLPCYESSLDEAAFVVYPFYPRASRDNVLDQLRQFLEEGLTKDLDVRDARVLLVELK